jgi:HD-GYP domain-containing protein (c-di-GMP phosphodiesterase class II)
LNHITWTKESSNLPTIVAAHHEKLDGTGYPLWDETIGDPADLKIMTICDICDALTASDEPYQSAINSKGAIDILVEESKRG